MSDHKDLIKFLLNISTNIFMEISQRGQILYASDKARYIFRQPELKGLIFTSLLPPETRRSIEDALNNVFYQHYPETLSFEFQERFYNLFLYPREQTIAACFEDITERRHLSHHLHQTRQRLDFAERTAHLGYWELDLADKRFYWSAEMFRIFGHKAATVGSKRNLIREEILQSDLPIYKNQLKKLLRTSMPVEGRVRLRRPDGDIIHCLFKAALVQDDRHQRIAGTFQDISSLVKHQQALEQARQKADDASKSKSYFLAQASHDLRQPMQALLLFITTLSEEKLTPPQQQLVQKIAASADGLKSLLDNLLDISKLDSGGICLEAEPFDIGILFCRLCMEYHQTSAIKKLKILCRVQHFKITSDALLLERIVRNLMSNALKYAHHKILLSCRKNKNEAVIRVIDDGSGIKTDELKLIFDEFYQSRNVPDNRSSGAGLGLSIVNKITNLLGAKVRVRSRFGHYTAFEVILPLFCQ